MYIPLDYEIDRKSGIMNISKIHLCGISLVTLLSNKHAKIANLDNDSKSLCNDLLYAIENAKSKISHT